MHHQCYQINKDEKITNTTSEKRKPQIIDETPF